MRTGQILFRVTNALFFLHILQFHVRYSIINKGCTRQDLKTAAMLNTD